VDDCAGRAVDCGDSVVTVVAVGRAVDETPAKTGVSSGDATEGGTGAQAVEVGREVSCTAPHGCKGELGSLSDENSPACRGSLPPSCDVFA